MTLKEKVIRLAKRHPNWTFRQIAAKLKCDKHNSVKSALRNYRISIGHVLKTVRYYVFEFLESHGDQTAIGEIVKYVIKQGKFCNYVAVGKHRSEWRKLNGIERDCRTYEGQPDRNMFKGLTREQLIKRLVELS